MSLDAVFSDLASRGWQVSNLYQQTAYTWRVNLRKPVEDGDWCTDWCEAPSLEEALEECMSKLNTAEFVADLAIKGGIAPSLSLAERLGFTPVPKTVITRR